MYEFYTTRCRRKDYVVKYLLIMKAVFLLLIIPLLHVSASTYAQRITLQEKNASIELVFKKIKKQTGYSFLYEDGVLTEAKKVNLTIKNESLEKTLDRLFAEQPLTFSIKGKTIVVQPKEKSFVDKVIEYFSAIDVRGKVVDERGEPLPGATVKVKGSSLGTVTDEDGEFFLKGVPEDAVIVIAYLGYKPLELKASASMGVIELELLTSELNEVTVSTGYWSTTKALSTGNIAKVTAKEIGNQPVTSPLLALQGRVAGLEITMPANATPGVAPKIRIRGNNSLRIGGKGVDYTKDGNYPLYVVDGVPVIASPIRSGPGELTIGGYDPLSTINPASIESIEVLKDGDATAIYGSRGANGVILITTVHKDKGSERTDINLNVYRGAGRVSNKLELLNTEQYLAMRKEAFANDGLPLANMDLLYWDQTRYTDWQDVFLGGSAGIIDAQGFISTSSKSTTFRIGGGVHNETLILPGNFGYKRASGQASITHTSTNQRFKLGANVNYGAETNDLFAGAAGTFIALSLSPNAPTLYNSDGSLNWEIQDVQGTLLSWDNPVASWLNKQKSSTRNLISSINLSYELLPGLSILVNSGYTDLLNREKTIRPIAGQQPTRTDLSGAATFADTRRGSWIVEPKLTYSKMLGEHQLDILMGTTWQQTTDNSLSIDASKYTSDALLSSLKSAGQVLISLDEASEYRYRSIYGRIGYNLKEKYLVNLTGRRDGSSRFGPNKRFGNFGALGLGWIFSKEQYLREHIPSLSFGKLRGSYGLNGSDAVSDYQFYNLYDILDNRLDGVQGLVPYALYNPEFVWEATKKLEFGLEMAFFDNRLGMEISWYRNRSSNQLVNYTTPYTTGFPSVLSNFNATVQNKGWESIVRVEPVVSKSWRWNLSLNLSLPRNKLLRFDGIETSPYVNQYKVGEPLSIQFLYRWAGVDPQSGLHRFVDENKDGKISNLDKRLMNPMEVRFYGGLNNTLQYKGVELSIQLQFSNQPGARNLPIMPGMPYNQPVEVLGRWFAVGDQTEIQRYAIPTPSPPLGSNIIDAVAAYGYAQQSDYNSQDASFVRLKSLSLTYLLASQWSKKLKLKQPRVFIQGQNLLTFTKYKGLDPETGNGLPPLRMVTTGIQIGF